MPTNGIPLAAAISNSIAREIDRNLGCSPAAETEEMLVRLRDGMTSRDLAGTLRQVDRAWRNLTDDAAVFAPIYGRLLCLEAADHHAALQLLSCAAGFSPDPDIAALTVLSMARLHRIENATREFATALGQYCIEPDGLLAVVGNSMLSTPDLEMVGWIGRTPDLLVTGMLSPMHPSSALEISIHPRPMFSQIVPPTRAGVAQPFTFRLPAPRLGSRIEVRCHGKILLGDGVPGPTGFSLDGRTEIRGRRVRGWARIGWHPTRPVRLRLEYVTRHRVALWTRPKSHPSWRWPFEVDIEASEMRGHRITVSAELPDGTWKPLPDAPLLLKPAILLSRRKPPTMEKWTPRLRTASPEPIPLLPCRLIDVVIPVFRGREETLACIQSVLSTIDDRAQLVVVDDASDDLTLSESLRALDADGRIRLLRNSRNRGFVFSANRGINLNPDRDVVLLNSDTLVFDDWLPRMQSAAYGSARVGSVTPLSNSGSIASYPFPAGGPMDPRTAASLHALAASTLCGEAVEIPVGVGFCLYLRRDCLRDVGDLDAVAFGKGYGEETDFCLRARSRGWSHFLAADVFIYHAGGVSFASRRTALLERSQRLLNLRHPGFDRFIADFLVQNPLRTSRRRLDEQRLRAAGHKIVLVITLALPGGVDRFVNQRCRILLDRGMFPLVLRPAAAGDVGRCELWTDEMELPNLHYDIPSELSDLINLLKSLSLDSIELQHFLHLDHRIIDAIRTLAVPYDVMIHDYSWVCPRVTLIGESGKYCGEPDVHTCQTCVRRNGSKLGERISVPALRIRSASWLAAARSVSAPSADTANRLKRYFPGLEIGVRPHREVSVAPAPARQAPRRLLRIALIGAIGTHKGYQILLACARDARARGLPMEFVVIGHTELDKPLLQTGRVFITGRYTEVEAPHLIRREDPDIAFLPSVWPETWCYTLDLALDAGLPVVAFDLGAIAERLRAVQHGDLLPLDIAPQRINDHLLMLGERLRGTDLTKLVFFPSLVSSARDDAKMRADNAGRKLMIKPAISSKTLNGSKAATSAKSGRLTKSANQPKAADRAKAANPVGSLKTNRTLEVQDGLSASVQVLPLSAGLYLFSVKSATPISTQAGGQLALPAMHIGLGPGVRSEQVEFIAGPSTHGAWLFSPGDLLVAKIIGTGVAMVLTSVRAPGGEVLSISVERLDNRADVRLTAESKDSPVTAPNTGRHDNMAVPSAAAAKAASTEGSVFKQADPKLPLSVEIGAHIRTRGDMTFSNLPWAGRVGPGLWIESFAVRPLENFGVKDIEYKGLTGSGFETPWLSDGKMCGTKGMATPLVGFAIRLKPSPAAAGYDCEYSGYFQSGIVIGPLRNGAPCRSSVANDSLEGIQVRLLKRASAPLPEAPRKVADASNKTSTRASDQAPVGAIRKPATVDDRKQDGVSSSPRREPTRGS